MKRYLLIEKMASTIYRKTFLLFFVALLFTNIIHSQIATSTWALTANGTVAVTGNVSGSAVAIGSALNTASYSAGSGITTGGWSNNAGSLRINEYYEFSVTPNANTIFSISTINYEVSRSAGNWLVQAFYSTDNFATSTAVSTSYGINTSTPTSNNNSVSINVQNATLKVRIYGWGSDGPGRSLRIRNFVINGTTTCTNPTVYTMTGAGGSFCSSASGSAIGLSNSETGVSYQLYRGVVAVGSAVSGTGSAISFGSYSSTGTYTVVATRTATLCTSTMSGSVTIFGFSSPITPTATAVNVNCPSDATGTITMTNSLSTASVSFLNASSQYIDLNNTLLSNRSEFSAEGWIKFDKNNYLNRMSIFGQNDVVEFGFEDNNLRCWTAGGGTVDLPLTSYPSDNGWHHIAVVANGSDLKFYLDGANVATTVYSTSNYGSDTNFTTKIGAGVMDATGGGFTGEVFKLGIWSRALSASELTSLSSGFVDYDGSLSGLLAGYSFSEGSGTNLSGVGSVAPAGTFVNGPSWTDPYTYSWTSAPAGFASNSKNITGLTARTYNLTTSLKSCTNSGSWVINSTGSINTAGTASSTPTICINTALTNITRTTTGATGISNNGVSGANGLPAGVSASWSSNTITISGTPTASGVFNYSIPLTGGCGTVNATGTITVTANNTAGTASSTPTICINTALTNITRTTTGATGISNNGVSGANGLPAGVSASWSSNTITISGTPTASGVFNYSIPLTGGCGTVNATGTITVTANNTAGTASSTPTICINTALTNISRTTTGATGISNNGVSGANGLPAGVSASWSSNTITISGTPTASGVFNYSIPLTGGCGTVNATGTITVTANNTAGTASSTPTICINTALTNITRTTTGATGISSNGVSGANGLPAGVSASWSSNTITISGTPTASGVFNYSIPLTGGCGTVNATGTITVTPNASVASVSGTSPLCIGANATYSANTVVSGGGSGAWSSSNTAIATVNSSGLVTAVSAGTSNIIYTINNGCGGTKSAQQSLTVNQVSAFAGPDQVGSTSTFTLAANTPTLGSGVWAIVSGPNTSTSQISDTTSPTAVFTASVSGSYLLSWTVTNSCGSNSDSVIIANCLSNTIVNGGFATATTGNNTAPNWVQATTYGSYVETYPENTYFGGNTAGNMTAELDSQASLRQVVSVIPGIVYAVSFRYARRESTITPTTVGVQVTIKDASNTNTLATSSTLSTTNSNPQIGSFTFTPTVSSIALEFHNPIHGNATYGTIVDDIVLLPISQPVPYAKTDPLGTFNTVNACTGIPIQLDVDNVLISGVSYSWTGTGGAVFSNATIKNPTVSFTNAGNQSATVTVTSVAGCLSTPSTTYANVRPTPAAPTVGTKIDTNCTSATGSVFLSGFPIGNWTLNPGLISGSGTSYTRTGLSAASYNFTITDANGCISLPSNVIISTIKTTWNGSTWSNSAPNIDKEVVIDMVGNYSINTNMGGCALTVTRGNVKVEPNVTLTITNAVTVNNSTAQLIFENNASLVQTTNAVNSGSIQYKRISNLMKNFDFSYWSSPVAGQTAKALSPNTLADKYFKFNGATNSWVFDDGIMAPGVGYIIRVPKPGTWPNGEVVTDPYLQPVTFTGVPNNGDKSFAVDANQYNLIGNPYPSAVDADLFINETNNKNMIYGALYFWTHNTAIAPSGAKYIYSSNDYATYTLTGGAAAATGGTTPTGKIAAGQSFFIANTAAGSFIFKNTMRVVGNNSQFFKFSKTTKTTAIENNRVWLNLTNTEGAFKQLLVGYLTGATNDWDNLYDGPTFDGNSYIDFYSINKTSKLTIQGRALPFDISDSVPLGYRSTVEGPFEITIDNTDGELSNKEILLEDKKIGITHNLTQKKYSFTAIKGVENDRFVLKYANKELTVDKNEIVNQMVTVYVKNKKITINSTDTALEKVVIYDILGRMLYLKENINSKEFIPDNFNSSNQSLILKITLKDETQTTKKINF